MFLNIIIIIIISFSISTLHGSSSETEKKKKKRKEIEVKLKACLNFTKILKHKTHPSLLYNSLVGSLSFLSKYSGNDFE